MTVSTHKIQDVTPLAETAATSRPASADLLAVLSTDVGLEAIQRAIAAVTVPSTKPSKAAILAALESVVA